MKEAQTVKDLDTLSRFKDYHFVQNEDEVAETRQHIYDPEEYFYYWVKIDGGCIVDAYGSFGAGYHNPVYRIKLK